MGVFLQWKEKYSSICVHVFTRVIPSCCASLLRLTEKRVKKPTSRGCCFRREKQKKVWKWKIFETHGRSSWLEICFCLPLLINHFENCWGLEIKWLGFCIYFRLNDKGYGVVRVYAICIWVRAIKYLLNSKLNEKSMEWNVWLFGNVQTHLDFLSVLHRQKLQSKRSILISILVNTSNNLLHRFLVSGKINSVSPAQSICSARMKNFTSSREILNFIVFDARLAAYLEDFILIFLSKWKWQDGSKDNHDGVRTFGIINSWIKQESIE